MERNILCLWQEKKILAALDPFIMGCGKGLSALIILLQNRNATCCKNMVEGLFLDIHNEL